MFHVEAKILKRSTGGSAAAHLAYRCRGVIADERLGRTFDFTRRKGLEASWMAAPAEAPSWARDVGSFAAAVEASEKRRDARLLRELTLSIPDELDGAAARALADRFVSEHLTKRGMVSAVAVHAEEVRVEGEEAPRHRNRHVHISSAFRAAGPEGFGKKVREWDHRDQLTEWRAAWAGMCNEALAAARAERRVDHRSHEARRDELRARATGLRAEGRTREAQAAEIEAVRLDHTPLPHLPREAFAAMLAGAKGDHPVFGEAIAARRAAEASKREAAALARELEVAFAGEVAQELGAELEAIEVCAAAEAEAEGQARDEERARADRALEADRLGAEEWWVGEFRAAKWHHIDRAWAPHEGHVLIPHRPDPESAVEAGWRALEAEQAAAFERGRPARAAARAAEGETAFEAWEEVVAPVREGARVRLGLGLTPAGQEAARRRAAERRREAEARMAPVEAGGATGKAQRHTAQNRRLAALDGEEVAEVVQEAVRRSARQRAGLEPRPPSRSLLEVESIEEIKDLVEEIMRLMRYDALSWDEAAAVYAQVCGGPVYARPDNEDIEEEDRLTLERRADPAWVRKEIAFGRRMAGVQGLPRASERRAESPGEPEGPREAPSRGPKPPEGLVEGPRTLQPSPGSSGASGAPTGPSTASGRPQEAPGGARAVPGPSSEPPRPSVAPPSAPREAERPPEPSTTFPRMLPRRPKPTAEQERVERDQAELGRRLIEEDAARVARWERAQDWRDLPHPDKGTTIPPGLTIERMRGPKPRPSVNDINGGFLWLAGRLGLSAPRGWWIEDRRHDIARTVAAVAAEPERREAMPAFDHSYRDVKPLSAWWAEAVRRWGDRLREWRGEIEAETVRFEASKEEERAERLARAAPRPAPEIRRPAPRPEEEDPWRPRGP